MNDAWWRWCWNIAITCWIVWRGLINTTTLTGVNQPKTHSCIISSRTLAIAEVFSTGFNSASLSPLTIFLDQLQLFLNAVCNHFTTVQHLDNSTWKRLYHIHHTICKLGHPHGSHHTMYKHCQMHNGPRAFTHLLVSYILLPDLDRFEIFVEYLSAISCG